MHKWAIRARVSVCAAAGAALGRQRLSATPAAVLSQQPARPALLTSLFFYPFSISFLHYYAGTVLWLCTLPAGIPSSFADTSLTQNETSFTNCYSHWHTKQLERVTKNCLNSTLTRNSGYIFPFAIMSHKLTGHYAGCERCSCVWLSRHNTVAVFYWLRFPLAAFQLPLKCSS